MALLKIHAGAPLQCHVLSAAQTTFSVRWESVPLFLRQINMTSSFRQALAGPRTVVTSRGPAFIRQRQSFPFFVPSPIFVRNVV